MKTIQEALAWRSAVKEYDTNAILTDAQVDELLEAVRMAPSSYGLQPYTVIVVKDKEVREKLRTVSYNQAQVTDASHFLVFASKINESEQDVRTFVEHIAEVRSMTIESLASYEGMMNGALTHMEGEVKKAWAAKQAYLGLGTLVLAAALSGVDASPMEGFDPASYDNILGLTEKGLTASVVCALGKRAETDSYSKMPKVRKNKEDFIIVK